MCIHFMIERFVQCAIAFNNKISLNLLKKKKKSTYLFSESRQGIYCKSYVSDLQFLEGK